MYARSRIEKEAFFSEVSRGLRAKAGPGVGALGPAVLGVTEKLRRATAGNAATDAWGVASARVFAIVFLSPSSIFDSIEVAPPSGVVSHRMASHKTLR